MGKSLGNFITLPDLFKRTTPEVVRFFILQFHYRSAVDFSNEGLALAGKQLAKINETVAMLRAKTNEYADNITNAELVGIKDSFEAAMNEDFNTPVAIVEFNKLMKMIAREVGSADKALLAEMNTLVHDFGENVLGLRFVEVEKVEETIPANVKELAEKRWQAKQEKNWAMADSYREEIKALGYVINDSKDGYTVEKL